MSLTLVSDQIIASGHALVTLTICFDDAASCDCKNYRSGLTMTLGHTSQQKATRVSKDFSCSNCSMSFMLVVVAMSGGVDSSVTAKLLADKVSNICHVEGRRHE